VTCDNASNNDTMIDKLQQLLDDFLGEPNRARCFTHVLNLAVKSIMQQFDVPQVNGNDIVDEATKELMKLASDIEGEEAITAQEGSSDENGDDNLEGWIDEWLRMSEEELEELEDEIKPVHLMLTKVS